MGKKRRNLSSSKNRRERRVKEKSHSSPGASLKDHIFCFMLGLPFFKTFLENQSPPSASFKNLILSHIPGFRSEEVHASRNGNILFHPMAAVRKRHIWILRILYLISLLILGLLCVKVFALLKGHVLSLKSLILVLPFMSTVFLKKKGPSGRLLKDHILSSLLRLPFLRRKSVILKKQEEEDEGITIDTLLEQIKDIGAQVRETIPYSSSRFATVGFLDNFLRHMEEVLKCPSIWVEILNHLIETLHVDFGFLRSFLIELKWKDSEHEILVDLQRRITSLAYQAEFIIDFYPVIVNDTLSSRVLIQELVKIAEQIKLIKSDVTRIPNEKKYHSTEARDAEKSSSFPSQATTTSIDEVVGLEDEVDKIMEYLLADMKQLDVVSIVGMPGLGKTTVAQKIYNTPSIMNHFHVRAWCSVSQTYQKRDLLLSILRDVSTSTEEMNQLPDEELAAKLYQSLKGRRYLIVVDDMWDIEAWQALVRSFPDDKIHSRILITSRLQKVASRTRAGSKVHLLREFSDNESWELFQKKLFQKETFFSQEFSDVGQQIVQSCKRLPLAIVMIAGLLVKVGKNINEWKRIAANLRSYILSDSKSQCKAILELSYNHLPDDLKSCFLYFGAFAEDEEIPVCKLKRLWTAEGFVRETEAKGLEDVAEEYFVDLVSRSLVIATKNRSQGGVKACRVHDLLREFCLEKAREESFLQVIHVDGRSCLSRRYNQRRLSIYSEVHHLMEAKPSGFLVRSLLHSAACEDSYPWDVSFIFQNFKLLRVLDLVFVDIRKSFHGIEFLIHLKYLAIRAETNLIPSSIAKLWNLQFLLVKLSRYHRYGGQVVDVPNSLWNMVNLRHVHIINRSASFNVKGLRGSRLQNSSLDNLVSLSTPHLSHGKDAENLLRRLRKLQKLRCVFMYSWDDSANCYQFPALDYLDQLVSLKVFCEGPSRWGKRCQLNFPSNLQKLTLSNFRLSWDDISKLGKTLHSLKVLKLIGDDLDDEWCMEDEDFPKLRYLKLGRLIHLRRWNVSEDSLPNLEQLVLDYCWKLEEIPSRFEDISTLRVITVRDCQPSVDDSARRVQTEQYELLQNEQLRVYIYPRN